MPPQRKDGPREEIVIRQADPSDLETLVRLNRKSALANPGDRARLQEHPDAMGVPRDHVVENRVWVAMVAGRVLGFATVLPRPDGDAELEALFVDPEAWRRGIGKALVLHCLSVAQRSGAGALHVIGNPHARAFYETCGFVPLGERDMRFGKGLLMKKQLANPGAGRDAINGRLCRRSTA